MSDIIDWELKWNKERLESMYVVIDVLILVEICYGSCHYLTLHKYSITLDFNVENLGVIFPMGKQF